MSDKSAIEWTDATWNPVTGCTKVSPGCANCYIERTPAFRMTGQRFERGRIPVRLHHDRLDQPLHWREPRRVFVVSMGDLFHEDVPDEFIDQVFAVMAISPQHTYQVLTKRPERMRAYIAAGERPVRFHDGSLSPRPASTATKVLWAAQNDGHALYSDDMEWPLPNVWLGVSVENQRMADERIPLLLETPAAVRFLSCEPLLGPLDLARYMTPKRELDRYEAEAVSAYGGNPAWGRWWEPPLDWVIVGGESGPGRAERKLVERNTDAAGVDANQAPRHLPVLWEPKYEALMWLRSIRDQCQAAGVPFFFKQWGGPRPTSGGRLLDGREWNEMPLQRSAVLA